MLLKEMFSTLSGPGSADNNIDWVGDLKFFINNEDSMMTQHIFPAVRKHRNHIGNPNVYKLYVKPVTCCLRAYCDKYNIENIKDKFTSDILENIAREFATNQEKFIKDGHYGKYKK